MKWVSHDCLPVWMLYKNNMYFFILKKKLYFLLSHWLIQWYMSFEYYLRHNFYDRNLHFLIFMHDKAWIVSVWCGPTPIILCSCMCNFPLKCTNLKNSAKCIKKWFSDLNYIPKNIIWKFWRLNYSFLDFTNWKIALTTT